MATEIDSIIYGYMDSVPTFTKWLRLNHIEYDLYHRSEMKSLKELHERYPYFRLHYCNYDDSLFIVIYKPNTKAKRRLLFMYHHEILPKLVQKTRTIKESYK